MINDITFRVTDHYDSPRVDMFFLKDAVGDHALLYRSGVTWFLVYHHKVTEAYTLHAEAPHSKTYADVDMIDALNGRR